jgi:hypothetical protein
VDCRRGAGGRQRQAALVERGEPLPVVGRGVDCPPDPGGEGREPGLLSRLVGVVGRRSEHVGGDRGRPLGGTDDDREPWVDLTNRSDQVPPVSVRHFLPTEEEIDTVVEPVGRGRRLRLGDRLDPGDGRQSITRPRQKLSVVVDV